MSDFSSIGPGVNGSVHSLNRLAATPASGGPSRLIEPAPASIASADADRVELSSFARLLDQLRQMPAVRHDLVATVRQAIEQGSYETDERINAAIEKLVQEEALGG